MSSRIEAGESLVTEVQWRLANNISKVLNQINRRKPEKQCACLGVEKFS